jgi:hypothetical protein
VNEAGDKRDGHLVTLAIFATSKGGRRVNQHMSYTKGICKMTMDEVVENGKFDLAPCME